jgi:AcrR family transcriptional regulator
MPRKSSGNPPGRPKAFCDKKALQAAIGVFAEKGFEGASLADLTSAMGINRFSLYATFGNKEQLYVKAMEGFNAARKQYVTAILAGNSARESVARLLKQSVENFTAHQGHGTCFVTQGPLTSAEASKETRKLMADRRAEVEQAIRHRLEQAIKEGEMPPDVSAEDLARMFAVLIQGFALQAQHGGTQEELLRVVDLAMEKWPPVVK